LIKRSRDTLNQYPFPVRAKESETTLFIAGHGTGNNTKSREAIENQVQLIRDQNIFANAHALYMEEAPFIAECYEMSETRNIVVTPFFISDGLHSFEDIPVMLGEPEKRVQERLKSGSPTWRNPTEKKGKRVWYALSIGSEPYMARVILEQVQDVWRSRHQWVSEAVTAPA
jgi:sirohydrochlorin cobaltochelatase